MRLCELQHSLDEAEQRHHPLGGLVPAGARVGACAACRGKHRAQLGGADAQRRKDPLESGEAKRPLLLRSRGRVRLEEASRCVEGAVRRRLLLQRHHLALVAQRLRVVVGQPKAQRRAQHRRLGLDLARLGAAQRHRRRVVHLEQPRVQIIVEHHVEAQDLKGTTRTLAAAAAATRRLPAAAASAARRHRC